ncbi:hypothetical protein ACHAQJ_009926 [Trichoderma viride]
MPKRIGRNKVKNSEYDFFINQLEGSSQNALGESDGSQTDEDPYHPEVNGKYIGPSKFKGNKNSQIGIQGCSHSVVDELHHTSPLHYDDEKSENPCTNISAKDSQVEREASHVWYDITLEDSHVQTENEYVDLGNEDELDIPDDWMPVESEAGLADPIQRFKGVELRDRETRLGKLLLLRKWT